MSSFPFAAGERVCNERRLKNGIQNFENRMVQHSITNGCFMDFALLGIANGEGGVFPMLILMGLKISIEGEDVLFKLPFKFLHIFPRIFPFAKLFPGKE